MTDFIAPRVSSDSASSEGKPKSLGNWTDGKNCISFGVSHVFAEKFTIGMLRRIPHLIRCAKFPLLRPGCVRIAKKRAKDANGSPRDDDKDDDVSLDASKWRGDILVKLSAALIDLCVAFDDLLETHSKAHMLTSDVSDHMIRSNTNYRPNAKYNKEPHHQYAFRATEHLRLGMDEEASVNWAIAICVFYQAVRATVETYIRTTPPYFKSTDVEYLQEFPLDIPQL
ncbi:hypothetical protein N7517_008792 [Penicillium concentricum]|uniref:Uncharacterized protein n=1 Tax=Penicillium concentricum TaxID=293559 RepID=A0A9W9V4G4_9EURO|nr:uncharacterized protein N7517_008792 [Penicillium concentricum]KAJ5365906.1 hypothetical protein N7517_008792 [Penicillium concentricum]